MAARKKTERRSQESVANDAHRVFWFTASAMSVAIRVFLVDPDQFDEMKSGRDGKNEGVFIPSLSLIMIDWNLPHDAAEETLLHELDHAARWRSGGSKILAHSSKAEEHEITVLNPARYDLLKRNGFLTFPKRPPTPGDA